MQSCLQVDVPDFELVDLPGIQLLPAAHAEVTRTLAQKYLQDQNTLVLCVIDVTTGTLTADPALRLVHDAKQLQNTVLALTKADLIRSDNDTQIVKFLGRVLRDASEDQDNLLLSGLAGCVAVVNRDHSDQLSLVEAEQAERRVFASMLKQLTLMQLRQSIKSCCKT